MKRMIISEEEKGRILEMHKDATKRHYLGEQAAISGTNTTPQDIDNKKQIDNQYLAKVNELVPFDSKKLKDMITTLESGIKQGGNITNLDVVQNFFKNQGQEFIEKINPKGYNELTNSDFKNYTSLLFNSSCSSCSQSSVYQMMLQDVLNLKQGLTFKAQQKTGTMVTLPNWMKEPKAKAVIDFYAKQIGLS